MPTKTIVRAPAAPNRPEMQPATQMTKLEAAAIQIYASLVRDIPIETLPEVAERFMHVAKGHARALIVICQPD